MSEPLGTDNDISTDRNQVKHRQPEEATMSNAISIKTMTTYTMPIEAIENIICDAGMMIGYWATEAVVDGTNQTYKITEEEAHDGEGSRDFTLTYTDIVRAMMKLATGEVAVRSDIREQISNAFIDYDLSDIDGEGADVIVQVACFGDVIYG
jgi:hypothetical protein